MSGASFRPFLSPWREKGNKRLWNVLFSLCREKSTKRAPPKGRTHGPPLWKPHPSSALIFAPRKCLRAVKSALRLAPATGSERHPSRSTCRVATQGYLTKCRHNCNRQTTTPHITKRLPRLLPSDRSGRLPATALLQRRCGYLADYRLNSALQFCRRQN